MPQGELVAPLTTLKQLLTEFRWQKEEDSLRHMPRKGSEYLDPYLWGGAELPRHTPRARLALLLWRATLLLRVPIKRATRDTRTAREAREASRAASQLPPTTLTFSRSNSSTKSLLSSPIDSPRPQLSLPDLNPPARRSSNGFVSWDTPPGLATGYSDERDGTVDFVISSSHSASSVPSSPHARLPPSPRAPTSPRSPLSRTPYSRAGTESPSWWLEAEPHTPGVTRTSRPSSSPGAFKLEALESRKRELQNRILRLERARSSSGGQSGRSSAGSSIDGSPSNREMSI